MNIIFLTLSGMDGIAFRGIYPDLMRKFRNEGHQVYIVSPSERRFGETTELREVDGVHILRVRTLNITKTHILEKGIGTLMLELQFKAAIKKYLKGVRFDLITYSTPPITFTNVIKYLKKENPQAVSYLQLKDIFPQNAVDIGMFGEKSIFNWYFRKKEKALYRISDYIGCMSPANVDFVLKHNPEIAAERVEVAPNSIELKEVVMQDGQENAERYYIRKKYGLPTDTPIFIYGGNLGRPQGIDYLIKCLDAVKGRIDCYFLVIGTGTEYEKLSRWYESRLRVERGEWRDNYEMEGRMFNIRLMKGLPKEDYDMIVRYCDVGLIFLDYRFTIPNYPSRLLSYLENKMPVICATDVNTDIGRIAEENGYGYWCESVKPEDFVALVDKMLKADRNVMGENGYEFLRNNYLVEHTYNAIMKHFSC